MSQTDGSFGFQGLKRGEALDLVAWRKGYGAFVRSGLAAARTSETLKIALAREAALSIAARFRPVAGKWFELVAFHREEKPWRAAFWAAAKLEAPGAAELAGLPPGRYRLAVLAVERRGGGIDRQLLGERRLRVAPGERHEVALDLDEIAAGFASISLKTRRMRRSELTGFGGSRTPARMDSGPVTTAVRPAQARISWTTRP